MEVMIEEPGILVNSLKDMREIPSPQINETNSTIDLRMEPEEFDAIETSSIQSEKDEVLLEFVNSKISNSSKPRKNLSSFKENMGLSTRSSVSRRSKDRETEIYPSCKENPSNCYYYSQMKKLQKELEKQKELNSVLSNENEVCPYSLIFRLSSFQFASKALQFMKQPEATISRSQR